MAFIFEPYYLNDIHNTRFVVVRSQRLTLIKYSRAISRVSRLIRCVILILYTRLLISYE
jgi:hypothetical protein